MLSGLTIRQLVLLLVVLPVVGVTAATAFLGLRAMESHLERRLQEDVELVARSIQLPIRDALVEGEVETVQRALTSAFRIGRVYGASVYDGDGRRIAAAGAGADLAPAEEVADLAERGDQQREYTEVGARRVYSFFLPLVTPSGEVAGLLQVTRRRREMEEYLRRMRFQASLSILAGTLLVVGVVVIGHQRIVGRPLDRLAESMARVEGGERHHRAETEVPTRELSGLARGLNSMVESLVRSEEEVARKSREQLALQARLQLSERMAAIGQLAAGVAHELGTPLSVVDGHAQRALREEDIEPDARRRWEAVRGECHRMKDILQQLLAMESRKAPPPEPVAPERIVRGAMSAASAEVERSGTGIEIVGSAPEEDVVMVHRRRIEQAVANLIRNAAQASPGGHIRLTWTVDADSLSLTVDDDGPGIPPSERSRVLQPFYTTKGPAEGTGLGLTLVQSVAEEHHGTVEIGASPLGGARITLTVPRDGVETSQETETKA